MRQPSFEPSSLPSSGVTPTPASDVAPRQSRRALWITVVLVGVALLATIGVLAGMVGRSDERDRHAAADGTRPGAATTPASKITPVPIAPDDLLPPSNAPRPRLSDDPPATAPAEATDAGAETDPRNQQKSRPKVVLPRGKGSLFLNTRPWCKVRVGGRDLGTTPLINVELPAGLHVLQLTDANGVRHTKSVRIRPDQPTKVFLDFSASE